MTAVHVHSPTRLGARFWLSHALLPLGLLLLGIWAFEAGDWDVRLSDPWYDRASRTWPAKKAWWAEWLIHKRGRDLVVVTGFAALAIFAGSYRVDRLRCCRRPSLYIVLCIALGSGSVALLKRVVDRHAPWSYDRYGGKVPYTGLFEPVAPGHPRGKDFPAGHASGALSLTGFYFVFRGRGRPRAAAAALLAALVLSAAFAFAQHARGAHFLSHNVYSAAICWSIAVGLYAFVFRGDLNSRRPILKPA